MDYLETGVRSNPKPVSRIRWVRLHVPVGQVGHFYNLVRSWAILGIFSTTGAAAFTAICLRGHW